MANNPSLIQQASEQRIRALFSSLDRNHDESLNREELQAFFDTASEAQIAGLWALIDRDGSGDVDLDELTKFFEVKRNPCDDEEPPAELLDPALLTRIDALFAALDRDGAGTIDAGELRDVFGKRDGKRMLRELDAVQKDGQVALVEFRQFFELYVTLGIEVSSRAAGVREAEATLAALEEVVQCAAAAPAPAAEPAPERAAEPAVAPRAKAKAKKKKYTVEDAAAIEARVDALFARLDADASGSVSADELRACLGLDESALVAELDTIDHDGRVSLDEWRAFFDQYRAFDGGDAQQATDAALASFENLADLSADLSPASPRKKLEDAQQLDAQLNSEAS